MMISWISDLYLRWIIIWLTTSNHYHWSWDDCTMSTSSLSQVSDILPISILVFGNCWYASRWTICIAANDQDTFICLTRGILWYSEFTLYACDFKFCILGLSIKKIYILITIRKWVIGQLYPFLCFQVQNFGLQSIIVESIIVTDNKWRVSVRSKCQDVIMWELGWCFRFEGFSIKSKKIICQWTL